MQSRETLCYCCVANISICKVETFKSLQFYTWPMMIWKISDGWLDRSIDRSIEGSGMYEYVQHHAIGDENDDNIMRSYAFICAALEWDTNEIPGTGYQRYRHLHLHNDVHASYCTTTKTHGIKLLLKFFIWLYIQETQMWSSYPSQSIIPQSIYSSRSLDGWIDRSISVTLAGFGWGVYLRSAEASAKKVSLRTSAGWGYVGIRLPPTIILFDVVCCCLWCCCCCWVVNHVVRLLVEIIKLK